MQCLFKLVASKYICIAITNHFEAEIHCGVEWFTNITYSNDIVNIVLHSCDTHPNVIRFKKQNSMNMYEAVVVYQ